MKLILKNEYLNTINVKITVFKINHDDRNERFYENTSVTFILKIHTNKIVETSHFVVDMKFNCLKLEVLTDTYQLLCDRMIFDIDLKNKQYIVLAPYTFYNLIDNKYTNTTDNSKSCYTVINYLYLPLVLNNKMIPKNSNNLFKNFLLGERVNVSIDNEINGVIPDINFVVSNKTNMLVIGNIYLTNTLDTNGVNPKTPLFVLGYARKYLDI